MRKEYRIAKGWEIFIWICLPLFMTLFGWLGIMPYTVEKFNLTLALILTPISIGLVFLMVLGLIDTRKSKLVIEKESIIHVGVFKTKVLDFKNIKGFKVDQNYLYYFPINENDNKIKVSTYVGKFGELRAWSEQKFENLDLEEFVNEEKEILENDEYGRTQEEREYKLTRAKNTTKILNTISWIVALSTWSYPHFYQVQILLCGILPIIGLIIYKTSNGLIRLDEKPNSAHPNILSTLFIPSCALMIRALMDFTIFDYSNLWKPAIVIFFVFGLIVLKGSKIEYNFKKGVTYLAILGMLMFGGMYAYGLLITTNVAFDESQPTVYKAKVLDKHTSSGKSTTYYLKLSEWGPQKEIDDVSVAKDIYKSKEIGDTAVVYFNNGLYKIPYYIVIE
jgi:hypothetical protein